MLSGAGKASNKKTLNKKYVVLRLFVIPSDWTLCHDCLGICFDSELFYIVRGVMMLSYFLLFQLKP